MLLKLGESVVDLNKIERQCGDRSITKIESEYSRSI